MWERNMDNDDTRKFAVTIMDGNDKPYTTYYHTGEEALIQYIRDCCERYGMENSDPDPDEPFTVIIKRISESGKLEFEHELMNTIFGSK